MVANWIKLEHPSPDKPEVVRLAEILGIDQDAAFGKCVRFWIWCDQQFLDGNRIAVSSLFLDRLCNCSGFAEGLLQVGWLKRLRDGAFSVPNFDRHNGQTAKSRALTRDRVRKTRNDYSVTKPPPDQEPDQDQELEEERNTKPNTKPVRAAARRAAPTSGDGAGVDGVYANAITDKDLGDAATVLELASRLVGRSLSDAEKVGVLSIAERALELGDNPGGMFRAMVLDRKRWKNANQQQEERARRKLAELQKANSGAGPKALGSVFAAAAKAAT